MWLGPRAMSTATHDFVVARVTQIEGFRDDVLIDMVMRRMYDAPDKSSFEASISVLMGERAGGFTAALCAFLGVDNAASTTAAPTFPPKPPALPSASGGPANGGPAYEEGGTNGVARCNGGAQYEEYGEEEYGEEEYGEEEYDDEYDEGEEEYSDEDEEEEEGWRGEEQQPQQSRLPPPQQPQQQPQPHESVAPPLLDAPAPSPQPDDAALASEDALASRAPAPASICPTLLPSAYASTRVPSSGGVDLLPAHMAGQMAAARASQPDAEPNGLSPSDQVSLRLRAMSTHDPAERDLGATCDDVGGGDVSSDLDVIMGRGGGSGGGSACCARSQTLPQAELALGNASGVAVCKSAQCAVACDGIEQAYLPTPLSDPPMEEEEIDQLRTWLAEAANQLYGRDAGGHADLVDRTAAVLRNSSLTSTVFAAFSAVDGAKTVDDSKPLSD